MSGIVARPAGAGISLRASWRGTRVGGCRPSSVAIGGFGFGPRPGRRCSMRRRKAWPRRRPDRWFTALC
jgi:hypothetical protein